MNKVSNQIRRTGLWMAIVAVSLFVLTACGTPRAEVVFTFMYTSDATQPYWEATIKDFEAQNPNIKVTLYVYQWADGPQKIDDMIKAGRPPNLSRVATRSIPEYVARGLVEPIDSLMTEQFRNEFIPVLINEGAQYQGRTFGLPVTASTRALYYNKDLFAKAGIAVPPKTWDELRDDAIKISKLGGVYGFGLPGNKSETERNTYFNYFLWGNGGDVLTPDGIRASFNSPQGVEALTFLSDLVKVGATQPDPTQDTRANLETKFKAGQFGMIITATKLAKQLDDEKKVSYGLAPIPFNKTSSALAVEDTLIMFKQADNREAAWKFVQFIYQDKYRKEYALKEGVLPEKLTLVDDRAFAGNPNTKFFIDQLKIAHFEPLNIKSADISKWVGDAVVDAYTGKAKPQAALDAAAAKSNEALAYSATAW